MCIVYLQSGSFLMHVNKVQFITLYRIIVRALILQKNLHIKWMLFLLPQAQEALEAITKACSSNQGNLLQLSIDAARARCTVGEITDAMEKVRYLTIQNA